METASMRRTPRFLEVDDTWATALQQSYERLLAQHLDAIAKTPPERLIYAWAAVANDYRELAHVLYASGEPLDRVRELLVSSARAHLELATLRRAGAPCTVDPSLYSTGNSRSTYLAICMALIGGQSNLALALAPLVWDPPDASYVAPNSVICTDMQQALAYAMKYALLENRDEAEAQLAHLTRVPEDIVGELLMMRGLISAQPERLLKGIVLALAWHAREAAEPDNYRVPKYFLCVPALGLAARGLQRGLVAREQLPANDVYFPRDLIET
jgi:hypothetical protein